MTTTRITAVAALSASLLLCATARADGPAKPPSTEDAQVAHVAEAHFAPPKAPEVPAGAMAAAIAVDPATGGSVAYARFPAGYVFRAHWHSHAEYTLLVSGKATFTLDGKSHQLVAGSYVAIPAKLPHSVTCAAGAECVLFTRRAGPTDYHMVPTK